MGCYNGKFFGIECKAGSNKPTALQERNLKEITASEGMAFVVNEDNMHNIAELLGATSVQLEFDF